MQLMSFFDKFKRSTSSSFYLPQIDGLRFLAVALVVVQMHVPHYIDEKFFQNQLITKNYWQLFLLEGNYGVFLFFVISGFILSLPFARSIFLKQSKINLKNYYLRRLTRLEPPYILALTLCFIAHLFITHTYSFTELWPHYVASLFYLHNIVYDNFSSVMPVAWTLEVEVQFYILAPLFCLVFLIRRSFIRWLIYGFITSGGIYNIWEYGRGIGNVYWFISFFFAGIMLADLYVNKVVLIKGKYWGYVLGIVSLLLFTFLVSRNSMAIFYVKLLAIVVLFYTVLTNDWIKEIFSAKPLVIIGGMCYSIYLVHFAVLSFTGTLLLQSGMQVNNVNYIGFYLLFFLAAILLASGVYFYFIEKPFMQLKINWQPKRKKVMRPQKV